MSRTEEDAQEKNGAPDAYQPPISRACPEEGIVPDKSIGMSNSDERACSSGGGPESRGLNACANESHLDEGHPDSGTVHFPSIEWVAMHLN